MEDKKKKEIPRVEFSIEFGDVNGVKLYEVLQAKGDKKKSSKEK
ncbi:hypothetical protein [Bacillus sp. MRMR6]|nr:hypothetical protein [Bacillus sp. MRMR6]